MVFLITQSFDRSKNLWNFVLARILRIYPGLIGATLFCVFIIGPLVTTLPVGEYLLHKETYNYLKVIFLFPMEWALPGVFEKSSFNTSVNGSLWTIPYEIMCYVLVAIIGLLGLLKRKEVVLFLFIVSLYAREHLKLFAPENVPWLYIPSLFDLFPFFSMGMVIYLYRDKIVLSHWYATISLLVLIISFRFGGFINAFTIFGGYLIFYLAYNQNIKLNNFAKYGDFSYGIYVFAFPIQQTVTFFFGSHITVIQNILISLPVTLLLATLSWYWIERPALKLKNNEIGTKLKVKYFINKSL